MGAQTAIAWCDSTFNPWIGCTKISPGCDNCYAERDMDTRRHVAKWGSGNPRKRTSPAYWKQPLRWDAERFVECGNCGARSVSMSKVEDICDVCASTDARSARRRVFCASLADVFDNEVDQRWRLDLFRLIRDTVNLDWLLLTKRIANAEKMINDTLGIIPPNVWLGATIVNQTEAARDIPKLLATPARIRFLSCEPMLGALCPWADDVSAQVDPNGPGIDWVIAGGESGPHARPMHPDWVRALRDFCKAAGTPFLFKQWGEYLPGSVESDGARNVWMPDGEHIDKTVFGSLEHRERISTKTIGDVDFGKVGKKIAGRVLDGRTHDAFPA